MQFKNNSGASSSSHTPKNSVWLNGKEYKWSDKLGDYVYWIPIGGGRVAPQTYKDALKKTQGQPETPTTEPTSEPAPTPSVEETPKEEQKTATSAPSSQSIEYLRKLHQNDKMTDAGIHSDNHNPLARAIVSLYRIKKYLIGDNATAASPILKKNGVREIAEKLREAAMSQGRLYKTGSYKKDLCDKIILFCDGILNDPSDDTTIEKNRQKLITFFTANLEGAQKSVSDEDGYRKNNYLERVQDNFEGIDPQKIKLPEITDGTEKQNNWARDIRDEALKHVLQDSTEPGNEYELKINREFGEGAAQKLRGIVYATALITASKLPHYEYWLAVRHKHSSNLFFPRGIVRAIYETFGESKPQFDELEEQSQETTQSEAAAPGYELDEDKFAQEGKYYRGEVSADNPDSWKNINSGSPRQNDWATTIRRKTIQNALSTLETRGDKFRADIRGLFGGDADADSLLKKALVALAHNNDARWWIDNRKLERDGAKTLETAIETLKEEYARPVASDMKSPEPDHSPAPSLSSDEAENAAMQIGNDVAAKQAIQEPTTEKKEKLPSMWLNGREYVWSDKYGDYICWLKIGGGKVVPLFYSHALEQKGASEHQQEEGLQKPVPYPKDVERERMEKTAAEIDALPESVAQIKQAEEELKQAEEEPRAEGKLPTNAAPSESVQDAAASLEPKEPQAMSDNEAEAASMEIGNDIEDGIHLKKESIPDTRPATKRQKVSRSELAKRISDNIENSGIVHFQQAAIDYPLDRPGVYYIDKTKLPTLKGNDDEVHEAEKIRENAIKEALEYGGDFEVEDRTSNYFGTDVYGIAGGDFLAYVIQAEVNKHPDAKYWIDTKKQSAKKRFFPKGLAQALISNFGQEYKQPEPTPEHEPSPAPSLSSDEAENAAMQIGNEVADKFPTEEERRAEEERLRRFEEDARTSDEWTSDLGQETDESDSSALDPDAADRLRRFDQTRRRNNEEGATADEWNADLGQETDESDSSALDPDAQKRLIKEDKRLRANRKARERRARKREEQQAQKARQEVPAALSSDEAENAAMQIGQEVEAREQEQAAPTPQKTETPKAAPKQRATRSKSTGETLRGGKPKAWIADKDTPSDYDRAVVHSVRNNLFKGWSDVLERVAQAIENGDEKEAGRILTKARNNAVNIYRRAYSVHGDGAALEILTGSAHGQSPEVSIRLALNKRLNEWTAGKDAAQIREIAARLRSKYQAGAPSKSGVKALTGQEGALERASAPEKRYAPGVTPGRPKTPDFGERYAVKIGDLQLDPKRFQFKLDVNEAGVTDELDGAKYNPDFAGEILVWRDPSDGKDYVVNGHHRFNLAKQSGYKGNIFVRYSRAKDANEAKIEGACVNIADGKGTATDAAEVMRHAPNAEQEFLERGVAPNRSQYARGRVLARLEPNVFNALKTGKLTEQQAYVIGDIFPTKNPDGTYDRNEDKQRAFFQKVSKELDKYADTGKSLPTARFEDMALAYATAQGVEDKNRQAGFGGLFDMGFDYDAEVDARAKIIGAIREHLQTNRGIARQLAKAQNVDAMKSKGVLLGDVNTSLASQERDAAARAVNRFKDDVRRPKLNNVLRPFVEELTRNEGRKNTDAKGEIDRKRREIIDGAVRAVENYYNDPDGLLATGE